MGTVSCGGDLDEGVGAGSGGGDLYVAGAISGGGPSESEESEGMSLIVCSRDCSGSDVRVPVGRVRPPCPVPRPRTPSCGSGVRGIVMW